MKIKGSHTLAVPRGVVWEAILDPEVLSRTLPGCEDMAPVGDNQFRGKLKMKVGPVQGVFEGGVELLDLDPPNGYRLKMDGKGAPGFVNGNGSIRLEDTEDGGTLLHYEIDAQVGGRIAAVGQRLLDSSAKVLTRQGPAGPGAAARRARAGCGRDRRRVGPACRHNGAGGAIRSNRRRRSRPRGPVPGRFRRPLCRRHGQRVLALPGRRRPGRTGGHRHFAPSMLVGTPASLQKGDTQQ